MLLIASSLILFFHFPRESKIRNNPFHGFLVITADPATATAACLRGNGNGPGLSFSPMPGRHRSSSTNVFFFYHRTRWERFQPRHRPRPYNGYLKATELAAHRGGADIKCPVACFAFFFLRA